MASSLSQNEHGFTVDPACLRLYIGYENNHNQAEMKELDIKKLEDRVDDLIQAVERLQQENKDLRESQSSLMTERGQLIEKTELARTRVEAMISRLKALEND